MVINRKKEMLKKAFPFFVGTFLFDIVQVSILKNFGLDTKKKSLSTF